MATEAAPVETAPNPDQNTTAPAATSGTVDYNLSTGAHPAAEASRDLAAFYDGLSTSAPSAATDHNAQTEDGTQSATAVEQSASTPAAQAPADEDHELPDKIRVRLSDPEDIAIAAIQRDQKVSFAKAALIYHGRNSKSATIPGTEAQAPASLEPTAVQTLQGQVDALTAEIKAEREGEDYLSPAHLEKADRLADLKLDLRDAKREEQQATQAREQTEEQSRDAEIVQAQSASQAEIVKAYPILLDKNSPLYKATVDVAREWANDPRQIDKLRGADAPERVLARALLRVPTLSTAAPAPLAPTAPPAAPAATRKPVPTASGSMTSAAAVTTKPSLASATANANTAKEANALMEELYGKEPLAL